MTWNEIIIQSFQNVWMMVIEFLPKLVGALIILIVGIAIAVGIGKLVRKIIEKLQIDRVFEKLGVGELFGKAGLKFSLSGLIGWFVKWFLIIVFLIAAFEAIGLTQITTFLNAVVGYLPNVIVAIVILLLGIAAGNFVYGLIKKGGEVAKLPNIQFLASIAKWAIAIFALMAALVQLGIASSLINNFFLAFAAMLAIAGGIAFGLGGKDWASEFLAKFRKDITEREE